jgi:hypothetical protein
MCFSLSCFQVQMMSFVPSFVSSEFAEVMRSNLLLMVLIVFDLWGLRLHRAQPLTVVFLTLLPCDRWRDPLQISSNQRLVWVFRSIFGMDRAALDKSALVEVQVFE